MDSRLERVAREAMRAAHAPYSSFRVGAALLDSRWRVFSGCNVENSSYGLTCCAERIALFKAVTAGSRTFERLLLLCERDIFITPCGACRQVLHEFAPRLPIVVVHDGGVRTVLAMNELLPSAFGADCLKELGESGGC